MGKITEILSHQTPKLESLVVLNLGVGNLESGFPYVTAQVWSDRYALPKKFSGSLPPNPNLDSLSQQWQLTYRALCEHLQFRASPKKSEPELEIAVEGLTNVSEIRFVELCNELQTTLNQWLKSPNFINIELKLRSYFNPDAEIRFIIETDVEELRRLPWQRWDFFKDYPLAEIALSNQEYHSHTLSKTPIKTEEVRILGILGDAQDIELEQEREFFQNLPKVVTHFLVNPSRAQLNTALWHPEGWDILFFAGHSCSEGSTGRIYLNDCEWRNGLTIEQLTEALDAAIANRLQLAIFNSCDGLGLANSLAKLDIPQVIVMREPIPNRVAEFFLKYFLEAFALEHKPLYLSVRQARRKLQGLEDDCPGASWLPVICQNPAVNPLAWTDLVSRETPQPVPVEVQLPPQPEQTPRYPSGSIPLDSTFYLEPSQLKSQIYPELNKPGALIRIKAPREMGKTSLLLRILNYAQHQGYKTVSLNLEQVDQSTFQDLNQFLRWLCSRTAYQLKLKPNLDEYWDDDFGIKLSCTSYFEDYLLEAIKTPLVLALDEVNQIFEHPKVAKDFFPLLRSWYEESKTSPIWQKLRLVVVHSTEIYVPLQLNQSPFNVGLPIQLVHFTFEEVQQLAQCYELNWDNGNEAEQLMALVGGHPALVNLALYHLSYGELTLQQLLENAPTSSGIYASHLQRHRVILNTQPELANALHAVISASGPAKIEPILAYKLSRMGLIKQIGAQVIPSCELYCQSYSQEFSYV